MFSQNVYPEYYYTDISVIFVTFRNSALQCALSPNSIGGDILVASLAQHLNLSDHRHHHDGLGGDGEVGGDGDLDDSHLHSWPDGWGWSPDASRDVNDKVRKTLDKICQTFGQNPQNLAYLSLS